MASRSGAGKRKSVGNRTRGTPKGRTAKPVRKLKSPRTVRLKGLVGAFIFGNICGAVEAQQPWRGHGILANAGLMVGYGLVTTLTLVVILSLTAARKRVVALIRR